MRIDGAARSLTSLSVVCGPTPANPASLCYDGAVRAADGERRLAAIMFSDIVGYTALMGRDESAGRQVRRRHRQVVGARAVQYGGEVVDENGDELVLCFTSAVDAVNSGLRVQQDLADDPDLAVRIGIHVGDVVFEGGRLYGDGVNLAARVRAVAEPGGICVSAEVWQAVRNQPNVEITALGEHKLKNIDRPVALYAVRGVAAEPTSHPRRGGPMRHRSNAPALVAAVAGGVALAALAWWIARPAADSAPIRSIAVLPLENLSGDPNQEYFVDGMTDTLIAELARIDSLRVISRTSVMAYKDTRKSLPEIAEDLGVDALLEGTVLRDGERIRITAQLIDARTDSHLWAEQYDRDLEGILALQSEIATVIADRVEARLTPEQEQRFANRPPADPAAHEEYLKGLFFAQKHTPSASIRARDHFHKAMELAPEYPLPYAGLADALSCSPLHTWTITADGADAVPTAVMDRALELATHAIDLDASLPEALTALGLATLFKHRDWEAAERSIERALEINPSYEFAQRAQAIVFALQGRFDEAVPAIERARTLDPLSPFVASMAGDIHAWSGNEEAAMALWRESHELDAAHPLGLQGMANVHCRRGQVDEAVALFAKARVLTEDDPLVVGDLGHCHAIAGHTDEARSLLRELEARAATTWVSPIAIARIHLGLREHDDALAQLERSQQVQAYRLLEVSVDDRWDPVRADPRFVEVMRGIGLEAG